MKSSFDKVYNVKGFGTDPLGDLSKINCQNDKGIWVLKGDVGYNIFISLITNESLFYYNTYTSIRVVLCPDIISLYNQEYNIENRDVQPKSQVGITNQWKRGNVIHAPVLIKPSGKVADAGNRIVVTTKISANENGIGFFFVIHTGVDSEDTQNANESTNNSHIDKVHLELNGIEEYTNVFGTGEINKTYNNYLHDILKIFSDSQNTTSKKDTPFWAKSSKFFKDNNGNDFFGKNLDYKKASEVIKDGRLNNNVNFSVLMDVMLKLKEIQPSYSIKDNTGFDKAHKNSILFKLDGKDRHCILQFIFSDLVYYKINNDIKRFNRLFKLYKDVLLSPEDGLSTMKFKLFQNQIKNIQHDRAGYIELHDYNKDSLPSNYTTCRKLIVKKLAENIQDHVDGNTFKTEETTGYQLHFSKLNKEFKERVK